jgi:hypothetical protein
MTSCNVLTTLVFISFFTVRDRIGCCISVEIIHVLAGSPNARLRLDYSGTPVPANYCFDLGVERCNRIHRGFYLFIVRCPSTRRSFAIPYPFTATQRKYIYLLHSRLVFSYLFSLTRKQNPLKVFLSAIDDNIK